MAKLPITTRRSINCLLKHVANQVAVGEALPTEVQMAALGEASRTTVRAALTHFVERGLIGGMKDRYLRRAPTPRDGFPDSDLHSGTEDLQQVLLGSIYQRDLPPGAMFTEAELSRAAGVSTIAVREFLIGFARYGLIEKCPRGGWRLCAFDPAFAQELGQVREMFELRAVEKVCLLAPDHPAFERLNDLHARHLAMCQVSPAQSDQFPALDQEFHTFLIGLLNNRFVEQLNDVVAMVFHYHYQWDKREEVPRMQYALQEHLAILRALTARDFAAALLAMRTHLETSRQTMLNSISMHDHHE